MTTTATTAAGFILAGGRSRRMGTHKATLAWGRGTLLDHMKALLSTVSQSVVVVGPVGVVGPGGLPDKEPWAGPVEGIRTALTATRTSINIVVAVDLPFLTPAFLSFLGSRLSDADAPADAPMVACKVGGRVPLCLAIHRDAAGAVESYRTAGGRSFRGMLDAVSAAVVSESEFRDAGFDPAMFLNLNTPEEYAKYRPG
jgi:molybdopterin-guanine dinucleotide biosynthesis protein A